jgi:F0F1-type ATP synthase membrane subunit b/b'
MDRKMATLNEEVKRLREEAATEMEREHRRRHQELEEGVHRIQANADAQIQAFRQAGIRSLQGYAAQAALDLAAKRIEEQAAGNLSEDSMQEFIHLVERGRN